MTPRTVAFHTLGCKLNFSESSALRQQFAAAGYAVADDFRAPADLYVVNTCSVTEEADRKCRRAVRRALRHNPAAQVVVTGCYAQLKPREIAEIEGVDLVLGAAEKFRMLEYVDRLASAPGKAWIAAGDVREARTFVGAASFGDRTRAFLKVQDGCDYACTFCTIPRARGASRSDTVARAVASARDLGARGVREVVLTGCNLGDFGRGPEVGESRLARQRRLRALGADAPPAEHFADLVRALDADDASAVARLRISSLEPNLCTDEVIDLVAGARRFVPHVHMPLQSGCDATLARMARRYRRDLYASRVERIRERMPAACLGVDVIVGFPGETDAEFAETVAFLEALDVAYLHVFTYSERAGTPAAEMPGAVPPHERRARNAVLTALSARKRAAFDARFRGTTRPVLWEEATDPTRMRGWTDNYVAVEAPRRDEAVGRIEQVAVG